MKRLKFIPSKCFIAIIFFLLDLYLSLAYFSFLFDQRDFQLIDVTYNNWNLTRFDDGLNILCS